MHQGALYDYVDLAQTRILLFLSSTRGSIRYGFLSFRNIIDAGAPKIPADLARPRSRLIHWEFVPGGKLFRVKIASI